MSTPVPKFKIGAPPSIVPKMSAPTVPSLKAPSLKALKSQSQTPQTPQTPSATVPSKPPVTPPPSVAIKRETVTAAKVEELKKEIIVTAEKQPDFLEWLLEGLPKEIK